MEIREGVESDVPDILRLNIELHEYSARGVPSRLRIAERYDDQARHEYVDKVLSDTNATYLVAKDGEHVLGYAEIHLQEPEEDLGGRPNSAGTSPSARRHPTATKRGDRGCPAR